MAVYMMEAIGEFSRKHPRGVVNLVRVVIFESSMVHKYLDQMDLALKSGSSFVDTVKAVRGYVGSAFKGNSVHRSAVGNRLSMPANCIFNKLTESSCITFSVGLFGSKSKAIPIENNESTRPQTEPIVPHYVPVESTSINFTILGTRKEDIEAVKRNIDKCCDEESVDIQIYGDDYSDIIKTLDPTQVLIKN